MNGQTIESIEQDYWEVPGPDASALIRNLHLARKKDINELSVEDLRLLINQNVSLSVTIPLAINILKENLFAEGDYYPGDLLISLLKSDPFFWKHNQSLKQQVANLCNGITVGSVQNYHISDSVERDILKALDYF